MASLLALDFDGVLCDGLREYFLAAWQAGCDRDPSWPEVPEPSLEDRFRLLRPVIEQGWEMPVLLQALRREVADAEVLADWPQLCDRVLKDWGLTTTELSQAMDRVRDRWIKRDRKEWLQLHHFYPGVAERLAQQTAPWVIISTKDGRFIAELLEQIPNLQPPLAIYGKEVGVPKTQTLIQLQVEFEQIAFVEDRLPALEAAAQLESVDLYLADWGYNTDRDRQQAMTSDRIQLLRLTDFSSGRSPALAASPVES
ncbi:HAD family hydrolase [Synechococcus elongatus]|uniref:HAD family hydrolase n=2 Tax=Synechococcus elongatus TaxID=32046 RepID=Q31QL0_SYNE7|nr:HAD family hydrolase [Synechococcus elongatus]ABB56659.1 conserved hypothetical protein [Synechococcus elongatus PCC 7942 = FACHB-805]AJD58796.1 hypothetical protein M744_13695 [Synechococcus elongatus UTEX 2973]MBD2589003.1 hypothetical protein [Synechococcus elongatus FACHB-242]MBD2690069.1 hypothetical protein [Synechococcus elongatus FACHB-1061]MBD2708512.1 hypothetical protein [Synechococcus elongatus PCC 7942 = FACHB-805]